MSSNKKFDRNICEIIRRLDARKLSHERAVRELESLQRMLAAMRYDIDLQDSIPQALALNQIAIVNGKILSPEETLNLNEDDYDVILNCVDRKLLARKDPDKRSKLEECSCENIGRDRLKLLRYMLEHPKIPICLESMDRVYGNVASFSANALAHSIAAFRKCLWEGPYIITETIWGESLSHTGSVYLLNDKYNYLVIRYKI